jgi:hypothetical protein
MKRFTVFLALAVLAGAAGAQVFPVRLYGGAQADRGYALTEDMEGGFCLGGQTFSFGPNVPARANAIALRTDVLGIPLWARVSAGDNDDEFRASVNVPDGCVFAGYTTSRGAGGFDILVTKFDPLGNVLWSRVYGDAGNEVALSICSTLDGGFALTGWTSSYGPPAPPNIFVLRLDPMGMPLWLRVYWPWMTNGEDYGHSIIELPGGGFAVCGRSRVFSLQQYDPFLMRLDPAGNVRWVQTTNGEGFDDEAWSVAVDLPGRILVAGNTMAFGSAPGLTEDVFVAAFDTAGVSLWSLTYGWPAGNERMNDDRSLGRTLDGGSVFCGYTTSVGPGLPNPNMLLVKLDPMGLWMWATSHPSPYWPGLLDDEAMPVIERAAGGYALTGFSNSWNLLGGGYDINLSTFDPVGLRPACAERVEPLLGAFPWTWWEYDTLSVRPHFDSLAFIDIRLPHDSVCYDTTHVGVGEQHGAVPALGLRLSARCGAVELELARAMPVVVAAYAADGRRLARLARRTFTAGRHVLPIPPGLPAGACIIRAEAGGAVASLKIVRH